MSGLRQKIHFYEFFGLKIPLAGISLSPLANEFNKCLILISYFLFLISVLQRSTLDEEPLLRYPGTEYCNLPANHSLEFSFCFYIFAQHYFKTAV